MQPFHFNSSLVCKRWHSLLTDENNDVWRLHCVRALAAEALKSELLSSLPTYKAKLRAFYHAWNPQDCSRCKQRSVLWPIALLYSFQEYLHQV